MKRKIIMAVSGAAAGILIGLLIFINRPDAEPAADEPVDKTLISKTQNTVLEDEHSTTEFGTDEYIEDKQTEETEPLMEAGGIVLVADDDMNYNAHKAEVLNTNAERATSTVYAAADTDVYAEMSKESEILGRVTFNQKLVTYGSVDGWYVIDFNGRDGFIPESYISSTELKKPEVVQQADAEIPSVAESSSTELADSGANTETASEQQPQSASEAPVTNDNPTGLTPEEIAILTEDTYNGPVAEYQEPSKTWDELAAEAYEELTPEQKEALDSLHWQ